MGHGHKCCGGWSPKQGTIMIGIFTIVCCFLWIAWEAYNIVWIERAIEQSENVCSPNPCENRGLCIPSERLENTLGYVCDCSGTPFTGYHCNTTHSRLGVKRTCGDYYREGYRQNGTYMMDFDGHSSNQKENERVPFVTGCKFTDYRAYTILKHDSIYRTAAEGPTTFGFEKKFYYEIDREIIDDFIKKNRMVCSQTFTFECKNTKLNIRDTEQDDERVNNASYLFYGGYGSGKEKIDFSGVELDGDFNPEPRCSCSRSGENTCAKADRSAPKTNKCHCDRGDNTLRMDETTFSTLTENIDEILPILGMFIVHDPEETGGSFFYDLSPLVCYEDFDILEVVEEERLILNAHTRSGLKVVWGLMLAMMVITVLLLICAIIMLVAVTYEACHALLPWLVMVLIFDIMLFIAIVIRWFYLGYLFVAIEVAISAMWIILTIYGMVVVGMHYSDCLNTRVMHM